MAKRDREKVGTLPTTSSTRFPPLDEDTGMPMGWACVTIGDVTAGKIAQQEPVGEGEFRYIDIGSVDNGAKRITEAKAVPVAKAPSRARQLVVTGDVLVSMTRPNLNAVAAVLPEHDGATASTGFDVLRTNGSVLPEWLFRIVRSRTFVEAMTVLVQGALYPAVRPADIRAFPFALPPVAEQQRIVARLEALEARSSRARAALDAIPLLLDQARKSILSAAFRGNLTTEWRGTNGDSTTAAKLLMELRNAHRDSTTKSRANAAQATEGVHELSSEYIPESWAIAELQDVCHPTKPICYGILMPGPHRDDGVPYVRVADFPKDYIRLETIRKTTAEMHAKFSRSRLAEGDLLLSIRGTVGRIAVVPPELRGGNITQDSARLSIHELVSTEFVAAMLRSPDTQNRMQRAVKGVAVRGINIGDVRPLQIPLPPLDEQREIVRRLEIAFARLDAAAEAHAAAVAELDRLDQALLAKAFRGELVPQDPADEPATVTLQRLRTPREVFDPFAYLLQFIPALLRASGGALPFARTLEGCALLLGPRDLIRLLEPIGGAPARQHFEKFAQPLKDGSFEPVLRQLIQSGAITHDAKRGHPLRLVEAKAPPVAPLIAEDARHVASVLALVPNEALETVAPAQVRKLCAKPAATLLATM
jgi:type I restriction enzyme S subunit